MSRSPVHLRAVREDDVPVLVELWADILRRADPADQAADVRGIVTQTLSAPLERIVVAEYDGRVAGAILLRATTVTPLNLEPVVLAVSPHVLPAFRRRGVGAALVEAAVSWAEELGIGHVASGSLSSSRDANRFLARLGLGPQLVLRVAPTAGVRARLLSHRTAARSSTRQRERLLATRRVLRRERALG